MILGIWDGHDAGACIVEDGKIKVAVNEERLTRKKLDIKFPDNSIKACLKYLKLNPSDIEVIAACGNQFSRVLARTFPFLEGDFYKFRRRLIDKPRFEKQKRLLKYKLTDLGSNFILKKITENQIKSKLDKMGFKNYKLYIVDHHTAHAASALFTSGFKEALIITLDGVGDGVSGTVSIYNDDEIKRLETIPAKDSLGLMYEQATTLTGFRELEDEGKLMCVADYSYPIPEEKNKIMNFFEVDGLKIKSKYSNIRRFIELEKVLWNTPREKFAYMVQKTLEKHMLSLFKNAIEETGIKDVCWSGGVASNIKANRIIRLNSGLKNWFVFPHMGDGGLAVGAALYVSYILEGTRPYRVEDVYFGPQFSEDEIEEELKKNKKILSYEKRKDSPQLAGDLINKNNYIFWFQGRMEYGPRALGNRSILAPTWSEDVKNRLNIFVKKRDWFQPFCPSLIEEDAKEIFEDFDGSYDKFMTMGFMARTKHRDKLLSVTHVDGSARPQMVGNENERYRRLISQVKKKSGLGIVLNTSFNIHGDPIVCSPKDAIETQIKTKTKYMFLEDYFIQLK